MGGAALCAVQRQRCINILCPKDPELYALLVLNCNKGITSQHWSCLCWGRGSGGVKSTGVSQSVRETSRDESQNILSTQKLFKTRDLELPVFLGSLPSCSPHSAGYTRTSVHPYFPVANKNQSPRLHMCHGQPASSHNVKTPLQLWTANLDRNYYWQWKRFQIH